jgi:hypothetical protein
MFLNMRSILQHLRFHFSFFLMPVFWFAYSQSANPDITKTIWAFVILHLLIYPASNAYNSYYDKDEGPIGGIAKPLPVNVQLYYTANFIDFIGILLAYYFCNPGFALAVLLYVLVSKAYSHPLIRLKKHPYLSWFIVGLFQGAFIYLAVNQLINKESFFDSKSILPALLTSFNLWAFYPITQIYQHEEDAKRGDITMSLKLGIKGTFVFTAVLFLLSTIGFYKYFYQADNWLPKNFVLYLICMAPSLLFYNYWVLNAWKNQANANFKNTMIMNLLGSACLNFFFLYLIFNH